MFPQQNTHTRESVFGKNRKDCDLLQKFARSTRNAKHQLCTSCKFQTCRGQTFIANNLDLTSSEFDGDLLVFEGGDDCVHLDGSFRLVIFDPQPLLLRHTAQLG